MPTLNPAWAAALQHTINSSPFFQLQAMKVLDLDLGRSRLELDVQRKHLQPFGFAHGGVFASLIDSAGFWAVFTELAPAQGLTTLEMKLNYLAPANEGRIIGLGRRIKLGKTICLADARVENPAGRLLAHGTVTLMAVPELNLHDAGLPAKFND